MVYRVITTFRLHPGWEDEQITLACDLRSLMRWHPGFLSYEVVRTAENSAVVLQSWESATDFERACACADSWLAHMPCYGRALLRRLTFAGEVVLCA